MDFAPVDSAVDGPLRVVAIRCRTAANAEAITSLVRTRDSGSGYSLPAAQVTRDGRRPAVRPLLRSIARRTIITTVLVCTVLGAIAGIPIGPFAIPINAAAAGVAGWLVVRAGLHRAAMSPLRMEVLATAGWLLEPGETLIVVALEREAAAVLAADARAHVSALDVVELPQEDQHELRARLSEQA